MSGRRRLGKLPRKPAEIVIGPRDTFVCQVLAKARVLTTKDLALLIFPSLAIARRRLRRLHDGGYIAGYVSAYSEENRWVLDRKGRRLLELGHGYAPSSAPKLTLHRQMLTRYWVLLAKHCHDDESLILRRFLFEWELKGSTLSTDSYRPDAVVLLHHGEHAYQWMIEVDTGTESIAYLRNKKMPSIVAWRDAGRTIAEVSVDTVFFVAASKRRLHSLLQTARSLGVAATGAVVDLQTTSLALGWS